MQTFLPYPDFAESAACLDRQRLGKQRVEAKQIYLALTQPGYGWQNHPAVRMWRGHHVSLLGYGIAICDEWISRGYDDSLRDWFYEKDDEVSIDGQGMHIDIPTPLWFGNVDFHLSHKSNLIRKLPSHYRPFWPDVPDDLPYIWPV